MTDTINTTPVTPSATRPAKRGTPKATKNDKVILKDKHIESFKKTRAEPGKRELHWDKLLDGFGVRVTDQGHCSYVFGARYPLFPKSYSLREIGPCTMSLADARAKAKRWIELLQQNKDPATEAARLEKEEARKRAHTFKSIAEEFIQDKVIGDDPAHPLQRAGDVVARTIRNIFIAAWKDRPIAGIDRDDLLAIVRATKRKHGRRGGPAAARASLTVLKSLFGWAVNQSYGLERNVARDIEPKDIIGEKTARSRVLNDGELKALWAAAGQCDYPVREAFQLLMLTGLRLNEVCGARWEEFDKKGQWVIGSERMKGKNSGPKQSRPFLVTLNAAMVRVIDDCHRFNDNDRGFVFTTTRGRAQFHIGSKVKKMVDGLMLGELRKIAVECGEDPRKVILVPWVVHDIRRSVRAGLSQLKDHAGRKIPLEVKEAVLAHVRGGIPGVYDPSTLYDLSDEKAEALSLWSARLAEIVDPAPQQPDEGSNVVRIRKAAS